MDKYDWQSKIKPNMLMLKAVGLWPTDDSYGYNFYTLYTIISVTLFIYGHNFFQTFNLFFIMDDLNALTATIFVALTDLLAILKSHAIIFNMKTLKRLMKLLKNDMFQPKTENQIKMTEGVVNIWKKIYGTFLVFAVGTLASWAVFPFWDGSVKSHRLPFLAWYPYDSKKSPFYEFTFIYQMASISYIAVCNLHVDTLIAALMMFVSAQCDILSDNLRNIRNEEDFLECISHHRKILKFASDSNKFFDLIVASQFFTSAVSIGLTMFQLTVVEPFSSESLSLMFYGSAILVQIFMYCWFGNEVEFKSKIIPFAAYEFDWTDTSIELKKNLTFFIARTQRPIKISAFNLFYLSLETFTTILRTAWSYFAVLHHINTTP